MGGNDQLVWMEASGVWARVPQRERARDKRKHNASNKRRKYEEKKNNSSERGSADTNGSCQHVDSSGEVAAESGSLCCSICLDEVTTHHKAVIAPCMHEYHHICISKWLTMKRECPLCKSQAHTVLYNIQDDGSFLERELTLPLKHVSNREDIMRRLAEILGEGLNELVRYQIGRRGQNEQQQQHTFFRNAAPRASDNPNGHRGERETTASAGPTPYSMRVQHHVNARRNELPRRSASTTPAARSHFQNFQNNFLGSGGRGQQEQQEEEALIAWRREIYDLELYAIPLGTHHHIPRSLVAPAGRQSRIKEWVHRELQALLETEHTTILRGFVMGLLATYGAQPPLPPSRLPPAEILAVNGEISPSGRLREVGNNSGAGAEEGGGDDPVSQLKPFLGAAAAHFWHELSCFATAPAYTIRTYDSIVRYARPGEAVRLRRGEDREEEKRDRRGGREREVDDRRNYRRRRSTSRLRSRDLHRRGHYSKRRRRHEGEEQEAEYRRHRQQTSEDRQGMELDQTEDSRWRMWKWGDSVSE
jgi:Ring finger domain